MRVVINRELESVRITGWKVKSDDESVLDFFQRSIDATSELIRVLNFEYAPLYSVKQTYNMNQIGKKVYQSLPSQIRAVKAGVDSLDHEDVSQGFRLLANLRSTFENQTRGMTLEELNDELRTLYASGYAEKMREMDRVGANMKFANPVVWMMYKYFAYEDRIIGETPIRTVGDLIKHCAKETYTCTKRFHFLNERLKDYGYKSLRDGLEHSPETDLMEIFTDPKFIAIAMQEELMEVWNENERIDKDDTKKWEKYFEHLPEDRRLVSVAENRVTRLGLPRSEN